MKKIISLVLFVFTIASYSQEKTISQTDTNSPTSTENYRKGVTIGKWTTVSLSSGISTPSSNFSDNAYAKNGTYLELAGAYYFSKFGIGVSVGQITNPTNENFASLTNSTGLSTTNTTQNWKQFYYGIGPEYKAQFGNFSATFSTKIGLQSVKSINLESNYANGETPIAILKIKSDKTSSLSYFSTAIKFGYNLSKSINLFATADYLSALSNKLTITESKISDINNNGLIDADDLKMAIGGVAINYDVTTTNIKPQSTNFGIGLSYRFGSKKGYDYYKANADNTKRKRPGRTTYNNITLERNQAKDDGDENNGTRAINHDASRSNNTNSIAAPESKGDDDDTTRRGKRKAKKECLKNGGSFWESGDGSYHCMMSLSTAKVGENTNNELFRSKKRKCFKAGGKWVTNSYGSFCWNPSASTKVYGPGDAHYGHITDKIDKKKKSKVEVSVILTNRSIEEPASMGGSGGWLNPITFSGADNDCDSDTSPVKRMNKAALIDAMAKDANLSKADAKRALETLTSNLSKSLGNGGSVQLVGFKQSISARAARTGRNPQTGATIKIASKKGYDYYKAKADNVKRINNSQNPQGNGGKTQRNKAELIDAMAKDANLSKADAGKALNTFMATILKELNNGNCVKLIVPGAINNGLRYGMDNGVLLDTLIRAEERRIIIKNKVKNESSKLIVPVAINKSLRQGVDNGVLLDTLIQAEKKEIKLKMKVDTVKRTDNSQNSQGDGNDEIQQGYTNKSTMIFVKVDGTSLRNSNTKIPKDKVIQESDKRMSKKSLRNRKRHGDKRYRERTKARTLRSADKRYRERTKARTLRSADKRYRERTKARTLRSADKRYRERTKARTLRSADKRYRERTKARTLRSADNRYRERTKARTLRSADNRYRERTKARTLRSADKRYRERIKGYRVKNKGNTIQNDKPVQITTEKNNKVNPSTNLATRFLKAQNYQTIQITKNTFQLTAPLIISKNQTDLISYNWTVKNNKQNKVDKFTGKTINYNFDTNGTYQIEITPVVNNKNLNSYHITIICN